MISINRTNQNQRTLSQSLGGFTRTNFHKSLGGFTLVELLIAMALFSFILLIIGVGFIYTVKIYRSNLASRTTQENARHAMEEISRHARYANRAEVPDAGTLCLGSDTQKIRFRVVSNRLAVHRLSRADDCANSSGSQEFITDTEVLTEFNVAIPESNQLLSTVTVTIKVATDTPDLFNSTTGDCDPAASGSEFCSTTVFTSALTIRGNQL